MELIIQPTFAFTAEHAEFVVFSLRSRRLLEAGSGIL
jgi:hypothetical protein